MENVEDIGSVIKSVVSELKIESKIDSSKLFNHWQEIVGSEIGKKAKPEKLKRGLLFVSATTPTWANELSLMSGQLIDKINSYIGKEIVKEIRFRSNL